MTNELILKELRAENAKKQHNVWIQIGKQRHGDIANMKKKPTLKYYYAICYVMKKYQDA